MDPVNWRTKFPAESREKVVNKIISSLMKRFPFSEHEKHMSDYKRIAVNFEEKVYMVARDQQDYIMRIKSRLESKNLNPGGKQGQSISVQATTLSQAHEQHSLPNVQDNTASGGVVASLASARPTVSISPHVAVPNNASENSNLQSVFGNSQRSVGNLSGSGQPFNISVNNLRQKQGRQNSPQIVSQQNHEQLNPHLCKQETISPSYITHKQLQPQHHYQPKLLNPTQQQTSQQSMLQTPVMCPSETRVAPLSDIWQDQMSYFNKTTQPGNKTQSQIAFRQTNHSQVALDNHQNVSSSSQNPLMQSQKQAHLLGRKLTATNMQQSHLDGQPNGCPNLHQQQPSLPCQQNTVQQQFQVQKINHSSAHHEQLSERNNMYVLPQSSQLLETQCASSGMRLFEVKMEGQTQQKASVLLPNQDQESQADSLERRLNSQTKPQKMEQLPNPSAEDQQQTYQTSGTLTSTSARRVSITENWQEDAYQMLQSLKSKYLTPLTDMYSTITCRLQQLNSISQQTETGSIEKLNSLRNRVNTIISNLSFPKSNIPPSYKESLGVFEKYIISILSVRGRGNSGPSQQHGQRSSDVHSMRQFVQLCSQTSPVQTQQDEKKPTFQPVNSQDSATTIQRSNATNLENDSMSVYEHPTLQSTEKYSGKIGSFNIVQQVSSGNLNIPRSNLQHVKTLLSHSPVHGPQSNVTSFESSCNTLQEMCLKQPKEERDVQTQTQKQELQDRHEMLHQSVQQKQIVQQHSRLVRLQSGASFPTALPKTYGSSCSQVPQCSTIDKKNLPMPLTEARTTFHPINSRSIKTSCLVPLPSSSVTGDFERPISDTSSLSNAGSIGDEQVNIAAKSPSPIAIGTPGISVSPLLEESSNVIHCDTSTTMSDELSASEQPIQRLIKVVNLMSSKALSASVLDIGSVVCTTDRISGSATLTGSGGSIGEDLVGMTNSRLQKSYLTWQGMTFGTKNTKRCRSTVPIDVIASATGSIGDSSKLSDMEIFDLESTAVSLFKRPRIEVNQTLLEEITAINHQLIDTVLDISDEDTPPTVVSAQFRGGQGTIVRCSFIAVSISPNLKSQQFPIQPLRLLVPANYPLCSPIFLHKLRVEVSDELEDLSAKVKSKLNMSLRRLTEPLSLGEIARTWDVCARAVISEYAQQNGGGNLSSKYGEWEDCLSAS
ncbi:mediator of RNA polymerase II transcription subunit 15a-like [Pyrus communis]|uniref:mediator of RNA polymerase II transcription subunit 15a-like n=1 Tax=Pyrus communis TaxID=23211 RepID=UPI0035C10D0A